MQCNVTLNEIFHHGRSIKGSVYKLVNKKLHWSTIPLKLEESFMLTLSCRSGKGGGGHILSVPGPGGFVLSADSEKKIFQKYSDVTISARTVSRFLLFFSFFFLATT